MNKSILLIAGEASGDLHGASLIEEMKRSDAEVEYFGIGGDKMKNAGLDLSYHIKDMAFLGFAEIVKYIPFIRRVQKNILKEVSRRNIKLAVLIDYPGFNLSIAKKLKKQNVEIIYYISPQIWAWGKKRIKKIKKLISQMLVILPFEAELYKSAGVDCTYVGHPLIKQIADYKFLSREEFAETFSLDANKDILLIMPGSRKQEIQELLPETLAAAKKLANDFNMQIIVACAPNLDEQIFKIPGAEKSKVVKGRTYELLKYSKFGIIKSGTSTLEAGLFALPAVVVYATSKITYFIAKSLIKIKNIALANIVAGESIYDELIQAKVNESNLYNACSAILRSENKFESIKAKLEIIKEKLGSLDASKNAAGIILNRLNEV